MHCLLIPLQKEKKKTPPKLKFPLIHLVPSLFLSSHLSSITLHSLSSITMLGKNILLGAFAVLASLAATVVADNVLALDPDNFDKAGHGLASSCLILLWARISS